MGNPEKEQLKTVIGSVGMSRFDVTLRCPRGGMQEAVRDRSWKGDRDVEVVSTATGPVDSGVNGFICSFIDRIIIYEAPL